MGDPAFLHFFATQFQRELNEVIIPGMPGASWDRKAAYLLWLERKPLDQDDFNDLL